jgi:ABC-2 type transport system ATP-binding protein
MAVISAAGLTRRFGPIMAVDDLTVDIPSGGVIGLVGPNGAGKSTLIRMLLGLVRPTSGQATVLDQPISHPSRFAGRVGSLIESPAFVPGLSARSNLTSMARLRRLPSGRVDEVLEVVGLVGRDREPVSRFSLGMKQRLAIAMALLPDPELLILDEPTNGLDPAGIVEIRGLLRSLGRAGRSVLVSSHLLAEIEAACDHVVVIRSGRLLYSGPMADLLARTRAHLDIEAEHAQDTGRLRDALASSGWVVNGDGTVLRVMAEAGRAAHLNRAAAGFGVTLASLVVVQDSLEDIFLAMTSPSDGAVATNAASTDLLEVA